MGSLSSHDFPGNGFPRVERILRLLGDNVLLLAWPWGVKGAAKRWNHLTAAKMTEPGYLRELEAGNIGVAQGAKSHGICSIDCDTEDFLAAFLSANPALVGSLRTRGARGGNVWVRCVGGYPLLCKIKTAKGDEVGEWRADGAQTIISGRHPSGCEYSFIVEAPPAVFKFESIVWPKGWRPPKAKEAQLSIEHSNAVNSGNAVTQETQETQVVFDCVSVFNAARFAPTERHQTDRRLFAMARHMKTWEKHQGRKATMAEKTAVFKAWWPLARDHIDPEMEFYAYQSKWLRGCETVKYCDDESPLISAWESAQTQPLPAEAIAATDEPRSPKMQRLIALCYQLQLLHGTEPFNLGSRDAARLLGTAHTTVFYWLGYLANEGDPSHILKKVFVGSKAARLTNEYVYLPLLKGTPPGNGRVDVSEFGPMSK